VSQARIELECPTDIIADLMNKISQRFSLIWLLLLLGFIGIFAAILWFAYHGTLHPILTQNDKLAHFLLYGIASFIGHKATNRRHLQWLRWSVPLFPGLFALFTVGEELVQQFSPYRTLDLIDLLASFIGIAIGYGLAEPLKMKS
jgi:VanZ family protein